MSIDKYLVATYNNKSYTCLHFTNDVWKDLTGYELNSELFKYLNGEAATVGMRKSFERLEKPQSPCIVLFKPKHAGETHIGVFIRDKVLHLPKTGAQFQPLEVVSLGFKSVRFFNVYSSNHCKRSI